jgi:hypothetical protein
VFYEEDFSYMNDSMMGEPPILDDIPELNEELFVEPDNRDGQDNAIYLQPPKSVLEIDEHA